LSIRCSSYIKSTVIAKGTLIFFTPHGLGKIYGKILLAVVANKMRRLGVPSLFI
jgi:hypothetical protein